MLLFRPILSLTLVYQHRSDMRNNKFIVTVSQAIPVIPMSRSWNVQRCLYSDSATSPDAYVSSNSRVSEYWERLGRPLSVLAPMVSQSDLPFRLLCRKYGADLCFTQMNHAQNFVTSKSFQDSQLDVYRLSVEGIQIHESGWNALKDMDWDRLDSLNLPLQSQRTNYRQLYDNRNDPPLKYKNRWTQYYEGISDGKNNNKSPLIVQIAGHDPIIMSEAAKIILHRTNTISDDFKYSGAVSGVDVNCGCPQAIAKSGRYGAFLMEESPHTVCEILSRLKKDLPHNVGVSVKIRIPEGGSKTTDGKRLLKDRIIRMIDSGYVFVLCLHGSLLQLSC